MDANEDKFGFRELFIGANYWDLFVSTSFTPTVDCTFLLLIVITGLCSTMLCLAPWQTGIHHVGTGPLAKSRRDCKNNRIAFQLSPKSLLSGLCDALRMVTFPHLGQSLTFIFVVVRPNTFFVGNTAWSCHWRQQICELDPHLFWWERNQRKGLSKVLVTHGTATEAVKCFILRSMGFQLLAKIRLIFHHMCDGGIVMHDHKLILLTHN